MPSHTRHSASDEIASPLARLPIISVAFVLMPIGLAWPARRLIATFAPHLHASEPLLPFLIITAFNFLTIGFGWALLKRRGVTGEALGFRKSGWMDWALAAVAALLLILAVYPLAIWIVQAIGLESPRTFEIPLTPGWRIAAAALLLGLLIPLAEEILFRGFLIGFFCERFGSPLLAGFGAAFFFAIVHVPRMGLGGGLFILLWAFIPVALFLRTRSILVTTAAHSINNLFAYIAVPLFMLPNP